MPVQFSYEEIWGDVRALWAAHKDHLWPILGVFIFLPTLALGLFASPQGQLTPDLNGLQKAMDYYRDNFWLIMATRIVSLTGIGAIYALLLGDRGQTVGQAIKSSLRLLPSMFLLSAFVRIVIGAGLVLFIIPAFYIAARTYLSQASMLAENIANPLRAFGRSFDLSSGNGWRIVGLAGLVILVTAVSVQVVALLIGIAGALLLDEDGVRISVAVMAALGQIAFELILALLAAALYRKLSGTRNGI